MTSPLRRGLRRIVDALQLDLFDAIDAPDPAVPRSSPRPTAIDPATGSEPPPAGGLLRHPLATREALLDGRVVAYRLVRIRRRSIGFVVDSHGLAVRAASRVSLREIDAAVHEKRAWIVARLAEQGERAARAAAARVVWRDGAAIDYLGEKLIVVLDPERGAVGGEATLVDLAASPAPAPAAGAAESASRRLVVGLPGDASPDRIRDAVRSWLQREARRVFGERAAHFAARLGVRVRRLSLSSAATRWGSANGSGSVRLHWRLIEHPLATIDYVVAHELAHLREMNHSPRFWTIVESVVPNYREVRRGLRAVEHRGTIE